MGLLGELLLLLFTCFIFLLPSSCHTGCLCQFVWVIPSHFLNINVLTMLPPAAVQAFCYFHVGDLFLIMFINVLYFNSNCHNYATKFPRLQWHYDLHSIQFTQLSLLSNNKWGFKIDAFRANYKWIDSYIAFLYSEYSKRSFISSHKHFFFAFYLIHTHLHSNEHIREQLCIRYFA